MSVSVTRLLQAVAEMQTASDRLRCDLHGRRPPVSAFERADAFARFFRLQNISACVLLRAVLVLKVSRAILEQRFEDRLYRSRLTIVNVLLVMPRDASETNNRLA